MKTLVAFYSVFGNTQKVAEVIAAELKEKGVVQLVSLDKLGGADLANLDLVILGAPTHNGGLPKAVRPFFSALPRRVLKKTPGAVFDTSRKAEGWWASFTASRRLTGKLRKMGGKLVTPPQSFYIAGCEGPLLDGELERVKAWTGQIVSALGDRGDASGI